MPGRALGLDIGDRRTGVAISDELGIFATALAVVERGPNDIRQLQQLAANNGIATIVAGLPKSLSGREGQQAAAARQYAETVGDELQLPVVYWDERLTSQMAERLLIEQGVNRVKRREQIDALAAAIMLQGWLDAEAFKRAGPGQNR